MTLLKELIGKDLVEPSHVSIGERQPNDYQLQIKTKYNRLQLNDFVNEKGLVVEEDKEERYLLVYKP
jgi:hypothetical protein